MCRAQRGSVVDRPESRDSSCHQLFDGNHHLPRRLRVFLAQILAHGLLDEELSAKPEGEVLIQTMPVRHGSTESFHIHLNFVDRRRCRWIHGNLEILTHPEIKRCQPQPQLYRLQRAVDYLPCHDPRLLRIEAAHGFVVVRGVLRIQVSSEAIHIRLVHGEWKNETQHIPLCLGDRPPAYDIRYGDA